VRAAYTLDCCQRQHRAALRALSSKRRGRVAVAGAMGMQHGSAAATVVGWSSRGGLGDFSRAPMGLINEHQIVAAPVTPPASAHRGHFPSDVSEPSGGLSCMSEMSEGSRCTNDFLRPLSERGSEEGDVSDDQDDTSPYSALNAAEEAWGDPSHGRLV